jgi:hypothetical protein
MPTSLIPLGSTCADSDPHTSMLHMTRCNDCDTMTITGGARVATTHDNWRS